MILMVLTLFAVMGITLSLYDFHTLFGKSASERACSLNFSDFPPLFIPKFALSKQTKQR